jgi:ABC-type sugar transport system ATPase subunit
MSTSEGQVADEPQTGQSGNGAGTLLQLRGITKTFGPVKALTSVDLDIPAGKVTALIGDNGAGKSSLIKTVSGLWAPDSGEIVWEGSPVRLHGPRDAEALGITTIYQDLALCDNLDIVQNMFLARQTLEDLHVTTVRSIRQPVASLSGGQRQSVAVAKAVMSQAKLVILDEPTAALGVAQTSMVLNLITTLSGRGVAVLVISHNLVDVFEVADRIAVLYLGRLVTSGPASDFDRQSAVEYMTMGAATQSGQDGTATPTAS